MKKLLVVLAVLAIAPLASATLGDLVLDCQRTQLDVGYLYTITVIQTVPNPNGSGGEMGITFDGEVTSVEDLTRFDFPSGVAWQWTFNGGIAQSDTIGGIWFGKTASTEYGTYGLGSKSLTGADYVGTVRFSFIATGQPTELVWYGVWDGVDMTGEVVPLCIPEPVTLALLGLGALLTRRRNNKIK